MIYWIFCDWRVALLALGLAYDDEPLVALTKKLRALDGAPDLVDVASAMRATGAKCWLGVTREGYKIVCQDVGIGEVRLHIEPGKQTLTVDGPCWNTDNAQQIHDLADESSSEALRYL